MDTGVHCAASWYANIGVCGTLEIRPLGRAVHVCVTTIKHNKFDLCSTLRTHNAAQCALLAAI